MNTVDKGKAWIETFTGKKFHLLAPTVDEIDIRDIAHALSLQCRWTGHCKYHFSTAQHSYYCSLLGPDNEALWRLLHDASESFMSDLSRPLKHYTEAGKAYRVQEKIVQDAIYNRFGLFGEEPESVHMADNQMLYAEKEQLMSGLPWDTDWTLGQGAENLGKSKITIEEWTPMEAEITFLLRFNQLYKGKKEINVNKSK